MNSKFVWSRAQEDNKNTNVIFWLEFECEKAQSVELELSAIDVYKLYVNEKFCLFGPARAAFGYSRADKIECELAQGKNRIAVQVCSYGIGTFSHTKQQPFFYCSFVADGKQYTAEDFLVYSNDARIKKVQRYSYQRAFSESYVQSADLSAMLKTPDKYFTRLELVTVPTLTIIDRNVPMPKRDLAEISSPISSGLALVNAEKKIPEWRFIDHVNPTFEYYPRAEISECTIDYVCQLDFDKTDAEGNELSAGKYALYDFGRNVSGFFGLCVTVREKAEIYYTYDEMKTGDVINFMRNDTCNVIKWELEPGYYELESSDIYEGRFVQIIVRSGEVDVEKVTLRAAENPDPYNLKFNCEDEEVVKIINAAKNTLAQNGLDLFMDCPGRERSGWINDIFFTRKAAEVLTGNNLIEKNSLQNYAMCEQNPSLPEGMVPMCYPADHFNGEFIPNCAMWYGINVCEYCIKTGDDAFAAQIKDQIYGIIKYFEGFENEHGLLEDLESWVFVEWSEANAKPFVSGLNFPSNMMYQAMLEAVAKLYGDGALTKKAAAMRENIIKLSYNGEFFEDNLLREDGKLVSKSHVSEACQYHAFYFGHADKNSHPELYRLLEDVFVPGRDKSKVYPNIDKVNIITGLMMRESIWLENNERERAVRETKEIFGHMAASTNTLWENTGYHASCNHGCAAYAAYVLVRAYTGFNGLVRGLPVFEDNYLGLDCSMELPLEKGTLYLTVKNGMREWRVE